MLRRSTVEASAQLSGRAVVGRGIHYALAYGKLSPLFCAVLLRCLRWQKLCLLRPPMMSRIKKVGTVNEHFVIYSHLIVQICRMRVFVNLRNFASRLLANSRLNVLCQATLRIRVIALAICHLRRSRQNYKVHLPSGLSRTKRALFSFALPKVKGDVRGRDVYLQLNRCADRFQLRLAISTRSRISGMRSNVTFRRLKVYRAQTKYALTVHRAQPTGRCFIARQIK